MTTADIVLLVAATLTALMAGLFFAFSCAVMPGLARLSDREFVAAMQAINRRIQNPVFFTVFFGAPVFLVLSVFLHYGQMPRFWFVLAACMIFLTGTFAVTVFGNVPLNNRLDRVDLLAAADAETALQRASFETRWNNLNTIRAAASTLSVILLLIACLN